MLIVYVCVCYVRIYICYIVKDAAKFLHCRCSYVRNLPWENEFNWSHCKIFCTSLRWFKMSSIKAFTYVSFVATIQPATENGYWLNLRLMLAKNLKENGYCHNSAAKNLKESWIPNRGKTPLDIWSYVFMLMTWQLSDNLRMWLFWLVFVAFSCVMEIFVMITKEKIVN